MLPDRVVILSDISWPLGGAESLALLQARLFADAGIPVTFIAGDDGAKCPLDRSKIEVVALGGAMLLERSLLDRGIGGVYNADMRTAVERAVLPRDTPHTIYHLHNWSQIFSPSVFHALKPVASRLFISAHDFGLVCPNLSYSNYQKGGAACHLKPLSMACIATHCDRRAYSHKLWRVARSMALRLTLDLARQRSLVGIIHPSMADWYVRGGMPADRLRVVRNPVNPFSKTRVAAEANTDLFFIGRVVHEKGVDLAAEAARIAGRRLRVIGDGDMLPELRQRYPEAVYEGWRNHAQISELIGQARAVIVPSRLPEAFTLVAHEALRSGVPVIAFSDVDGQEAADIGGAIVVPPREASSLAAAVRRLDDDEAVRRMSVVAFEECHRFSNTADTWRETLLDHFSDLLNASHSQRAGAPPRSAAGVPAQPAQ